MLANLVRWTAHDDIPLSVQGPGFIDCHLYRQQNRLILHLINLTSTGAWRAPIEEIISVGPIDVRVKLPENVKGRNVRLLVADRKETAAIQEDWATITLNSLTDHEVLVLE